MKVLVKKILKNEIKQNHYKKKWRNQDHHQEQIDFKNSKINFLRWTQFNKILFVKKNQKRVRKSKNLKVLIIIKMDLNLYLNMNRINN